MGSKQTLLKVSHRLLIRCHVSCTMVCISFLSLPSLSSFHFPTILRYLGLLALALFSFILATTCLLKQLILPVHFQKPYSQRPNRSYGRNNQTMDGFCIFE